MHKAVDSRAHRTSAFTDSTAAFVTLIEDDLKDADAGVGVTMSEQGLSANTSVPGPGRLAACLILSLMWLAIGVTHIGEPGIAQFMVRVMGAPFGALLATLVWWLFFVRVPWVHKGIPIVAAAVSIAAVLIPKGGNPAMYIFGFTPFLVTAWLGWIALTCAMPWRPRLAGLVVAVVASIGFFGLVRIDGLDGGFAAEYRWVWTPTAEDQVLAFQKAGIADSTGKAIEKPADVHPGPLDWPAFRGKARDGVVAGTSIATDWQANPPKTLWKHPIGPGWSSMALFRGMLFTQEQRGEEELVACYDAKNGSQIWTFAVAARFNEAIAGPGPRATPAYHDGKLLCQGANGHLVCLDAFSGSLLWKRDLRADTGAAVPSWGFSASPLAHNGIVVAYAGARDKTLVAYKLDSGEPAWTSSRQGNAEQSYASAQLATLAGAPLLLIPTDQGTTAYDPDTGKLLWEHAWPTSGIVRCLQPALVGGTDIVIGTGLGFGTQRIRVERKDGNWATTEVWKTTQFKPYYNDMVVHDGHGYGFDNNFFCCVDLEDGKVKWKARGYGSGQALLLAGQGLLLISTEKGELALVKASPDSHAELGKVKVIDGKTWNHPILSGDRVFIRNGQEIACVLLPGPSKASP